jgi:ERCC4-type nuclease
METTIEQKTEPKNIVENSTDLFNKVVITIDSREGALITEINAEHQSKSENIIIQQKSLSVGDIIIEYAYEVLLIIERKKLNDLAASICDGRYTEQSLRLEKTPIHNHNIIYLVEGDIRKYKETTRIRRGTLYSTLLSLNSYKGFSVLRTFDIAETATCLLQYAEKIYKNGKKSSFYYSEASKTYDETQKQKTTILDVMKQTKKSTITIDNISIIMLSQIPNVSVNAAKAIMSKYTNFPELLSALSAEPNCLDGIKIEGTCGKQRKINKSAIESIKAHLFI